jgi:hypothetical protein
MNFPVASLRVPGIGAGNCSKKKLEGVSKGHPFLFSNNLYSFLLLLQKKRIKEKEAGKDNLILFVRPLHHAFTAPPNRMRFAPFPVCPAHLQRLLYYKCGIMVSGIISSVLKVLITGKKRGDASPLQNLGLKQLEVCKQ